MRQLRQALFLVFCLFGSLLYADEALLKKPEAQRFIREMVKEHHFDRNQVIAILREAKFQPQIIESMDKPFEKKNWDVYRNLFMTAERIQKGRAFWANNQEALAKAEREYGVPAPIIVAIVGVETLYGERQGTYRVLDALSTLAFYYPKRSAYFSKELREFLLLCREQKVPATEYVGSYAGAMGMPQFMPSSYRSYAIDADGKGRRDLMRENADVIASVANYLHVHGWNIKDAVAEPALVKGWKYSRIDRNNKSPEYSLNYLRAAGVIPQKSINNPPHKAGLIELVTDQGNEFWLAFPNFYVITKYNSSPQYALVVYLLSEQLRGEPNVSQSNNLSRR